MSMRIDSSLISGSLVVGVGGLGVLAEDVPSTGESGAGYLFNDLTFPDDNGKEVRGEILTLPSAGDLFADEDSGFSFVGAPDGTYTFTYQLYVDGVLTNPVATVTLIVGDYIANVVETQATQNSSLSASSSASFVASVISSQAAQNGASFAASTGTSTSTIASTQAAQNSVSFATNFEVSDAQVVSTQAAQNSSSSASSAPGAAPNAVVTGVVTVSGAPVTRTYEHWYLTDSDINNLNKAGSAINIINSGESLSVIAGAATVAVSGATIGGSYTLVAWVAGSGLNDSEFYFRDVSVTIEAG